MVPSRLALMRPAGYLRLTYPPESRSVALKSYTFSNLGLRARISELANLYRRQSADTAEQVRTLISRLRDVERRVREHSGMELTGRRMLDIGPGQKLHQ